MRLPLALSAFTIIPLNYWHYWLFRVGDINLVTWLTAWLEELGHLWFLWQLLLLAGLFMLVAKLGAQFRHAVWWLLVPLVAVPLFWMEERSFGADGSSGMLPDPKVLGYYALFFLFGSFLYQRRITMHRWWALFLLPALTVVFLSGVVFLYPGLLGWQETVVTRMVAAVLQAAYAWLMSFGMIGLFRLVAAKERYWVRYLSDASYWLYLCHLSLVIGMQMVLVNLTLNVHLKVLLICLVVSGILLLIYAWGVRYTWIGTILNGKRIRTHA